MVVSVELASKVKVLLFVQSAAAETAVRAARTVARMMLGIVDGLIGGCLNRYASGLRVEEGLGNIMTEEWVSCGLFDYKTQVRWREKNETNVG